MKLERYEEAVKVYEEAVDRDASNHDLRAALKNAKLELKKSKRKNYYKILGVEKVRRLIAGRAWTRGEGSGDVAGDLKRFPPSLQDASDSEIKKAYRKAALRCHPGKLRARFTAVHDLFFFLLVVSHSSGHNRLLIGLPWRALLLHSYPSPPLPPLTLTDSILVWQTVSQRKRRRAPRSSSRSWARRTPFCQTTTSAAGTTLARTLRA